MKQIKAFSKRYTFLSSPKPQIKIWNSHISEFKIVQYYPGNSLAVQRLGVHTLTTEGLGSISGLGTQIPQATRCRAVLHNSLIFDSGWHNKSSYFLTQSTLTAFHKIYSINIPSGHHLDTQNWFPMFDPRCGSFLYFDLVSVFVSTLSHTCLLRSKDELPFLL